MLVIEMCACIQTKNRENAPAMIDTGEEGVITGCLLGFEGEFILVEFFLFLLGLLVVDRVCTRCAHDISGWPREIPMVGGTYCLHRKAL